MLGAWNFIVVILCICLLMNSCSNAIVAKVDVLVIKAKDVKESIEIEKFKFDPILLKTSANQKSLKETVLERLIQEAILLNNAQSQGISISKNEFENTLNKLSSADIIKKQNIDSKAWKEKQRKRMIIQKLIDKEVVNKIPVDEKEIEDYYKQNQKEFQQPAQFRARQIVVDTKEHADEILKKIKKGEDFAGLAKEYSLSPDRIRGGDLGFFNISTFPPVFTDICSQLKIGGISNVVATDYGYQIFQLLDKRRPRKLSLNEVRNKIESMIREKKSETAFKEWFEKLKNEAHITINQKALEEINVF